MPLFPLIAASLAFEIGRFFLPGLFLLWSLLQLRFPETSRLSIAAFALTSILWGGVIGMGAVRDADALTPQLSLAFLIGIGFVNVICVVVAIVAMIDCRRRRKDGVAGGSMATLALLGALLFDGLFVYGFATNYLEKNSPPSVEESSEPATRQHFEDRNFSFLAPDGWVTGKNPRKFNPDASYFMSARGSSVWCIVIAEDLGVVSLDTLQEIVLMNSRKKAKRVLSERIDEHVIGDLTWRFIQLQYETEKLRLNWLDMITAHNGFFYQVIVWGTDGATRAEDVLRYGREAVNGFALIDRDRQSSAQRARVADFDSALFPYRVRIGDRTWFEWEEMEEESPEAEFAALQTTNACWGVYPIHLGSLYRHSWKPPPPSPPSSTSTCTRKRSNLQRS